MDKKERILEKHLKELVNTSAASYTDVEEMKKMEEWQAVLNAMDEYLDSEQFTNMQYYYEYCKENGYVTPQEWLKEHKHF